MHEIEAPLPAPFSIEQIDEDREAISASLFAHVDA